MRVLPDQRTASTEDVGVGRSAETVACELLAYGEELAALGAAQVGGRFSDVVGADEFIKSSANAFLLGVLFTQGIPAERAWAGPYLLAQRLGHFDLVRLAEDVPAIARAVAAPPALHRFVHTLPGWIASAARRLLDEYVGRADAIWPDGSGVAEVTARLQRFDGIGPKKATMAAEILMRHFGVRLTGVEQGGVAYDVHVRRVFLRTGMAERDTPEAVADAARCACPEAPGRLDLAAWLVGRDWCRPTSPLCGECRLGPVCPQLVERRVTGVGSREVSRGGADAAS